MSSATHTRSPLPPTPCGPLSEEIVGALVEGRTPRMSCVPNSTEALGRDLQLSLCALYELHYLGLDGVGGDREWDPEIIRVRRLLEEHFLEHIRNNVANGDDARAEMEDLSIEPTSGEGVSWHLKDAGTWAQMREYFAHRSIYHLKEADPHAWAIPRIRGQVKASFVAVEYDEYGAGRGERVHQQLWADLMAAAGLDPEYLGYLDRVTGETLATVNIMSLFGLRRELRGATLGHFAATEITSSPGSARLAAALRRMGAPAACEFFYTEHVEADAVHEQVMRHDVVGGFLEHEPQLEADVVFGMRAMAYLDEASDEAIMSAWGRGRSSLLRA